MKLLEKKGNSLFFCGYNLEELSLKFGTPFFLFSENALRNNFQSFKKAFTRYYDKVAIDYSVKTNNELSILELLQSEGSDAEISSGYELDLVEMAGFKGHQICFDGPCKSKKEIELAIDKNIRIFNLDALEDLALLNEVAAQRGKIVKFTFRVHPGEKGFMNKLSQYYISKFGIPLRKAKEAYRESLKFKNLKAAGISAHIGSQVTSIKAYINTVRKMAELAGQLEKLDIDIEEINLGGGFPVMTLQKNSIPKIALSQLGLEFKSRVPPIIDFGSAISSEFAKGVAGLRNRPTMVLEPGRSIVSDIGILVCKIMAIKDKWIFLDASTNFLPEMIFFAQRDILPANKMGKGAVKKYNIAGRSLNSADVFHLNKALPEAKLGDVAVILDAGAYSISRANRFTTLSPAVYLINGANAINPIRREETFEDVLAPMISRRKPDSAVLPTQI